RRSEWKHRLADTRHAAAGGPIGVSPGAAQGNALANRRSKMTHNTAMRGEKIYDFELDITGVTDYGVSMDAILAGTEKIPLPGARFDLAVDGRGKGRLAGRQHGVDYLRVRAD